MIQKVDTFESIRINGVKIDIEGLIGILGSTGENSISLECGDTIYESLDEIKANKSAISIPFKVKCGETTIDFGPFAVYISGRSSSSHRQKALSKELAAYVPVLAKYPTISLFVAMQFVVFGYPWIFSHFSFGSPTKVFGLSLTDIALVVLMGISMVALILQYISYWSKTKVYIIRSGFWARHKEQIAVGVIVAIIVALFSFFIENLSSV